MPRLRQIPLAEVHDTARGIYRALFGDRDPVAEPGTATGTPGNWWTVFAAVPDCFDHAVQGFAFYRSPKRKLDPKLRELGQTRAGFARGSQFVFSQHCKTSRDAGLEEAKIQAVPSWQVADCYTPLERAVLAYTDCLVLDGGRVPDGEVHATMSRALRLEYDDVDERVVEVAAPGDAAQDVMAVVDES